MLPFQLGKKTSSNICQERGNDVRDHVTLHHENRLNMCSYTLCLHSLQMMQSNIDGMMANYDQISAEREELLESLADV